MLKLLRGRLTKTTPKQQKYTKLAATAVAALGLAGLFRAFVKPDVIHLFDVTLAFTDLLSVVLAGNGAHFINRMIAYSKEKRKNMLSISDVVDALDNNVIYPVFQPIYKLSTDEVVGFEILARVDHPVYGRINPVEFIHLIEQAPPEVTQRFTEYMMRETARCYMVLHERGKDFQMSINIFSNDLIDARVVSSISRALVQYGMPFDRLTLEVTEATLMKDLNQAIKVLAGLDSLDVKFALDDYGTHIVSFLRFSRGMWVDEVKVHSGIACNERLAGERELMMGILRTARDAGIMVTVIRVKNEEELEIAKRLGVERVQGNVIAHPMNIDELIVWMESNGHLSNR